MKKTKSVTISKHNENSTPLFLTAVSLVEFRVWLLEGVVRLSAGRFASVAANHTGEILAGNVPEETLRRLLPPFELEDTHTLIWVVVDAIPRKEEDFPFSRVCRWFGFDAAGHRRLSADLISTGLTVEQPLLPEFAKKVWNERYIAMHLRGGPRLCEMLGVPLPAQSANWSDDLQTALLDSLVHDMHDTLPCAVFSALFCYERHVPVPPKVGAVVDLGIVLKEALLEPGILKDHHLLGLRKVSKNLVEERASSELESLLYCPDVIAPMSFLDWLGTIPFPVLAAVLFLHWKYCCEKAGGLDLRILRRSLAQLGAYRFVRFLSAAVYLTGVYWGFQEIAVEYHAWQKKKAMRDDKTP